MHDPISITHRGHLQVILNLLQNAADAMGGVEDRPQRMHARQDRSDAEPGAIVLWGYCKQSQKAAAHRFL
jgi:nitrogen fixation/metabolism regulation signal transduction histidine kinase